jgi:PX domain-containing protein kinase-like protein
LSGIKANLPPKKYFGNTDRQFLSDRQKGLQEYLTQVTKEPHVAACRALKRFLDPSNYPQDYHDKAYRDVSMFFRSNPEWKIMEPLKDIGWRINKHYYLIGSKSLSSEPPRILTWINRGPDYNVPEQDIEPLLKVLVNINHPNILSPITATCNGTGLFITRKYVPYGSLHDYIYRTNPSQHYLTNYSNPSNQVVVESAIKRFGRQILETLQFLKKKGFVLGHLHAGNIIIEEDMCKLIDLENCIMGLPVFHRSFILELRKIQGAEAEVIYCFGHLLYEMAFGNPLTTPTMEAPPRDHSVNPILELILTPAGVKALPTIEQLIDKPYFALVPSMAAAGKPSIKMPKHLKDDVIPLMRARVDARLVDNQRKVYQFNRTTKVHESVMSEEEKQKRRKKVKKQMTQEALQKEESEAYPTSSLKKRSSVPDTSITATTTTKSTPTKSKTTSATTNGSVKGGGATATPAPPTTVPPPPQQQKSNPPPSSGNPERGALLNSIESFGKQKLKRVTTNDRSAPKL